MKLLIDLGKATFVVIVCTLILLTFAMGVSAISKASEPDGVELKELSINYKNFLSGSRDPMINNNGLDHRLMGEEINLNVNLDVSSYLYFNNTVHSMTDRPDDGGSGQFRVIGWNYRIGARITKSIELGYNHFSQHFLDTSYQYGGFPIQNSIELTFFLYRKTTPGESLL